MPPVARARDDAPLRVGVIGDPIPNFPPQETIASSLRHAGGDRVETVWYPTPSLEHDAEAALADVDAIWCAPGSPFASLDGALEGIRVARESARPFLGTCAGFQHGVLEFARHVLGRDRAAHAEYGAHGDLFIEGLLCSLAGEVMSVEVIDPVVRGLYGQSEVAERYYCQFGLNESNTATLEAAGLRVAGRDSLDGGTRIMRLESHPYFLLTLFVPQTSSTPMVPHPLIAGFVAAARRGVEVRG